MLAAFYKQKSLRENGRRLFEEAKAKAKAKSKSNNSRRLRKGKDMTRVLFSKHPIRTLPASERKSTVFFGDDTAQGEMDGKRNKYCPMTQLKYPGGQGGPTTLNLAENVNPQDDEDVQVVPIISINRTPVKFRGSAKDPSSRGSPVSRPCFALEREDKDLSGERAEHADGKENRVKLHDHCLRTFPGLQGKHEDIFSPLVSPQSSSAKHTSHAEVAPWDKESPDPRYKSLRTSSPCFTKTGPHYTGSGMSPLSCPTFVPSKRMSAANSNAWTTSQWSPADHDDANVPPLPLHVVQRSPSTSLRRDTLSNFSLI